MTARPSPPATVDAPRTWSWTRSRLRSPRSSKATAPDTASASTASVAPTPALLAEALSRPAARTVSTDVHVLVDRTGEADGKLTIPAERAVELRNRKGGRSC